MSMDLSSLLMRSSGSAEVAIEEASKDEVAEDGDGEGEGSREGYLENDAEDEGAENDLDEPSLCRDMTNDLPAVTSLLMEETLMLLPRVLPDLPAPTRSRFRDEVSDGALSFLGGMFSLPLP